MCPERAGVCGVLLSRVRQSSILWGYARLELDKCVVVYEYAEHHYEERAYSRKRKLGSRGVC